MNTNDTAPWENKTETDATAPRRAKQKEKPAPRPVKVATRPVHVPLDAVEMVEREAERAEAGLGETVAALIRYALARKAALAKHYASSKKKAKGSKGSKK